MICFSTLPLEGRDGYKRMDVFKKEGVENIEFTWNTGIYPEDREDFLEKSFFVLKTGLKITSMHSPLRDYEGVEVDLSALDEWDRKFGIREVEKSIVAYSLLLGDSICGEGIVVHCGRKFEKDERKRKIEKSIESLKEILDFNERFGFEIRLENTLPGELGCFLEDLCEIKEKLKSPKIKFCLDTGHYNIGKKQDDVLREMSEHITEIHLHDNWGDEDLHLSPGEGEIDFNNLLSIVKCRYFVFELFDFNSNLFKRCVNWAAPYHGFNHFPK